MINLLKGGPNLEQLIKLIVEKNFKANDLLSLGGGPTIESLLKNKTRSTGGEMQVGLTEGGQGNNDSMKLSTIGYTDRMGGTPVAR